MDERIASIEDATPGELTDWGKKCAKELEKLAGAGKKKCRPRTAPSAGKKKKEEDPARTMIAASDAPAAAADSLSQAAPQKKKEKKKKMNEVDGEAGGATEQAKRVAADPDVAAPKKRKAEAAADGAVRPVKKQKVAPATMVTHSTPEEETKKRDEEAPEGEKKKKKKKKAKIVQEGDAPNVAPNEPAATPKKREAAVQGNNDMPPTEPVVTPKKRKASVQEGPPTKKKIKTDDGTSRAAVAEVDHGESADAEVDHGESADAEVDHGESADAEVDHGESADATHTDDFALTSVTDVINQVYRRVILHLPEVVDKLDACNVDVTQITTNEAKLDSADTPPRIAFRLQAGEKGAADYDAAAGVLETMVAKFQFCLALTGYLAENSTLSKGHVFTVKMRGLTVADVLKMERPKYQKKAAKALNELKALQ